MGAAFRRQGGSFPAPMSKGGTGRPASQTAVETTQSGASGKLTEFFGCVTHEFVIWFSVGAGGGFEGSQNEKSSDG
ncbi:hypothetical protein HPP92_004212 [Vanilla planifolia]|uniref:Uncharacterized protein n=1 Tax=Vanilla planifolia TaxID=51239 RepID=A0A835RWC2_VANPL|nr:hypothetical protein HPP92_004212 [Vanilla planifolia]